MDELHKENFEAEVSLKTSSSMENKCQIRDIVLEKELASGLLATVYKGKQTLLERTVAIKILSKKELADGIALQRFQQEASLAANLDHPNIAKILGYGKAASGDPFLMMEFVDGITLREFLDSRGHEARSLADFKAIFLPLLSALNYAHEKGIVHRDVKPGNIMLTKTVQGELLPKLVDFGIAKVFIESNTQQQHTRTGTIIGTPAYMSPEQCLGKPVDGRSDLYSLACVMYEFLCGEALFKAETSLAVMGMHAQAQPPSVKIFSSKSMQPTQLCSTILSALQKDPKQRPATALHFSDDLNKHLDGSPEVNYRTQSRLSIAIMAVMLLFVLTAGIIALVAFPKMKLQTHNDASKTTVFGESTGSKHAQLRKDKGTMDQRSVLDRYFSLIKELNLKRATRKEELAEAYAQAGESINILLRQNDPAIKDRPQLELTALKFANEGAALSIETNIPKFFFRCARNQFEILDGRKDGEKQINKRVKDANQHWPGSPETIELTADGILNSMASADEAQAKAFLNLLKVPHDEETEHIRLMWLRSLEARMAAYQGDKNKALTLLKPVLEQLDSGFDSGLLMSPRSTVALLHKTIGPTLIKAKRPNQYVELLKKEIETRSKFYGLNGQAHLCKMIAEFYRSRNERAKAIAYDEQVIQLCEQNAGEVVDRTLVARLYKNLVKEMSDANDPRYSAKLAAYKSKLDSMPASVGTK